MEVLKEESKDSLTKAYESGWNSALEMAACRLEHEFVKAFGRDTLSSIAIYLKSLKHESTQSQK